MSWSEKLLEKLNRWEDFFAAVLYAALTISFIMGWLYIYFHVLLTDYSLALLGAIVITICITWIYGFINYKSKCFIPLLVLLSIGGVIHFMGHIFIFNDLIAGKVLTEAEFNEKWWTWFLRYNAGSYPPYMIAIFIYLIFDLLFYIFFSGHFQTFTEIQRKPKNLSYLDRELCLSIITI
uniref:Uncharacterized protein n=1 Tax=Panagrolaimus sp. ES5 TaxID=591445 RepID=A0AC34FTZ3_9BILA